MRRLLLLALPLLLLATACAETPRVDGSSPEAYEASLTRIRESLDERREVEFESALMAMSLDELGKAVETAKKGGDPASEEEQAAALRAALNGLTADEVIGKAAPARDRLMQQPQP